jgi:hypothetical protein
MRRIGEKISSGKQAAKGCELDVEKAFDKPHRVHDRERYL